MTDEEWNNSFARSLGLQMSGLLEGEHDAQGRPQVDDDFLLLFNAGEDGVDFHLPTLPEEIRWEAFMDTSYSAGLKAERLPQAGRRLRPEAPLAWPCS